LTAFAQKEYPAQVDHSAQTPLWGTTTGLLRGMAVRQLYSFALNFLFSMAGIIAAALFICGYAAISLENRLFINKAAISMVLAVLLWLLASITLPANAVNDGLLAAGSNIFGIVVFLICAMTLVEILLHYHLFDIIERYLRLRGWSAYHMAMALGVITYVLSTFLPNLTTVIVCIQIARRLFKSDDLLRVAALIVIASNAGGGFSPIGDVNTLMLWFAHKFSAWQVISQGFLPSAALLAITSYFLLGPLKKVQLLQPESELAITLSRSDRAIIAMAVGAFFLPLICSLFNLPAYLGLVTGLAVVWIMIDLAKVVRPQPTHLQASIRKFLQASDIESIQFFLGILLAVAALDSLGILKATTLAVLGSAPDIMHVAASFIGLGIASAFVDNVPLTAAAINAISNVAPALWTLLAMAVTNGGSLLIIGSASGVVAMGMLPQMTFGRYMRLATWPTLIGLAAGIAIWIGEYWLFSA
jgi:Na+/H+ antiporter NhaD/arsenite permease-like protein